MKSKKRSRASGHGGGSGNGGASAPSLSAWTGQDHEHRNQRQRERQQNKKRKESASGEGAALPVLNIHHVNDHDDNNERQQEMSFAERRTAALTHGTKEKMSEIQLRLHWVRAQKQLSALKNRLSAWDPQDENAIVVGLETDPVKDNSPSADGSDEAHGNPKRRKGRKGPESWKLRGAARPAHEVYDFDVRYVDPHQTAMDNAQAKARRTVNVLAYYKGRVSSIVLSDNYATPNRDGDLLLTPRLLSLIRQYLTLLMQYGHLSLELKRFKTAREAWLECVDLEGDPPSTPNSDSGSTSQSADAPSCSVTTAREELVRMDLQQMASSPKRIQAAWKFLSERVAHDRSTWISFTRAMVAVLLHRDDVDSCLVEAIRSNLYCAYYLAFWEQFHSAVEYTEDLCDSDDAPQTDLELALEYGSDKLLAKVWQSSGAATALRRILVDALRGKHTSLKEADVEIISRLEKFQQELSSRDGEIPDDSATGTSAPPSDAVDVEMYVGMFRTAVEMIQEAGLLR